MHVYDSTTFYIGTFIIGLIITAVFLANRKHSIICCDQLVAQLHPHQLHGLDEFIDSPIDGVAFWRASHGLAGLWKRWRNRVVFQQLYQVHAEFEPVTEQENRYLMVRVSRLTSASMLALLFGMLRYIAPRRAGVEGQKALKIYAEIAGWVHAAYADDGIPTCAFYIASIL